MSARRSAPARTARNSGGLPPKDLETEARPVTLDLSTYFNPTRLVSKEVEKIVGWLSLPGDEMARVLSPEIKIKDGRFLSVFEHLSLRQKSLILRDDRFLLCLDRDYLMERLTRGAYWTIFDGLKGKDREFFSSLFGTVVDRYARQLLRRIFRDSYKELEFMMHGRAELADGVIVCGDELVVVEVKSARLLLLTYA